MGLYVLGDLPEAQHARIAAHVAGCASCRQAEQEYRLLVCEVQFSAPDATVREGLSDRIRSAAAREIASERRRLALRRFVAAASSAAAVLLLGLGVWGAWRMANPTPSPSSPAVAVPQAPARPALLKEWQYDGARAAPSIPADEVVVQGSSMYLLQDSPLGRGVSAIDIATGARMWQSRSLDLAYLSADASHVFGLAGSRGTTEVVALAASDGRELWRYAQADSQRLLTPHAPLPLSGGRLCWTHAGVVHMLDAETGEQLWTRRLPAEGQLSAAVADGKDLYVLTGKSLYCLDRDSGREAWREPLGAGRSGHRRALVAMAPGRIYFLRTKLGHTARIFCMDVASRRIAWSRPAAAAQSLLATSGGVFLRGGEDIVALDARNGQPLWTRTASGCGALTVIDGLIHFVDSSDAGRLVAVDPRTGREAWEVPGIHSCDAIARIGNTGYIKTRDGTVRALAFGGFGS